ncbi:MAG TPA: three-Cys-motif partner protein TcmP [Croceibacterium sp.]|nr:three-Cys-motif partner protein TcmP [Croceibacterium sp.]
MTTTVVPPVPPEYAGREQAYIKHLFLRRYLGRLVHKIGSFAEQIVYIDGFSGPWKSGTENYADTSFGIALKALSDARASWANMSGRSRDVRMSAHLVETDLAAFAQLQTIGPHYPAVDVQPYPGDFIEVAQTIAAAIPPSAFSFVLVDPKGFALDMGKLRPLLARDRSEVVFNFMFDFANRFTKLPQLQTTFDRLFVGVDWRDELDQLEANPATSPYDRKAAFLRWFKRAVQNVGGFQYVAEVEIQYPGRSRTFYYLVYGTRKPAGIKVFRDCQIKALEEQSAVTGRMQTQAIANTGQGFLFETLPSGPDRRLKTSLDRERDAARDMLLRLVPSEPGAMWGTLWPRVLADHVISEGTLGRIANELRKAEILSIPAWSSERKQIPDDQYRIFRGPRFPPT